MKLLKIANVTKNLKSLEQSQLDLTMSLAWYTSVQGNAAPFKDLDRSIVNRLDSTFRQFIAVKWDKENSKWVFNSAKSKKLVGSDNFQNPKYTFDQFVELCRSKLDQKQVELLKKQEAEQALDPVAQKQKEINDAKATVKKYLTGKALTLTKVQLLDIVNEIYNTSPAVAAPDSNPAFDAA